MGHALQFYLSIDDRNIVERILSENETICFYQSQPSAKIEAGDPEIIFQRGPGGTFWITQSEGWKALKIVKRSINLPEFIDDHESLTIEYSRGSHINDVIIFGRLYYYSHYFNEQDEKVDKPNSFTTWSRSVFRRTKKHLIRHGVVSYIGPRAKALHDLGVVTLKM